MVAVKSLGSCTFLSPHGLEAGEREHNRSRSRAAGRRCDIGRCPRRPSCASDRSARDSTTSTVTPGMTAPELSRTVPVMTLCACATAGPPRYRHNPTPRVRERRQMHFLIPTPLWSVTSSNNGWQSEPRNTGESYRIGYYRNNYLILDSTPLTLHISTKPGHYGTGRCKSTRFPGAAALQRYVDRAVWIQNIGSPNGYAPFLPRQPLPGVPSRPFLMQLARSDQSFGNAPTTELCAPASWRTVSRFTGMTFYRHDRFGNLIQWYAAARRQARRGPAANRA